MPKFEKQYVYFMWDSVLEGKMVFCADYIPDLQQRVENGDVYNYTKVVQGEDNKPFRKDISRSCWQFAYYDPYYELKCAYEQGKVIQHFDTCNKVWVDATNKLDWTDNIERYRVKPEEKPEKQLVTKHELAKWLADGCGQYIDIEYNMARTYYNYEISEEGMTVHTDTRVRIWGDTEWHIPTREYMYSEEQ